MDEANRCDQLILVREGRVVADATPAEVKSQAGTDDLDQAFLRLIRAQMEVVQSVATRAYPPYAMTAINNAIEQVSAERSKLGAYQNRR